ncbi:pilin N-terminal domain-containing protein [Corynebacterium urinipleomorphum]|uniref:pilin N-terminal domain-containing protein n=1 Tax=Corynebacterium urinipleomorphum TaxID=1852380 RepID=UPI0011776787|nr:pilin N-terminal domain-containing protein [Corynebacterium urinipleomorphum]
MTTRMIKAALAAAAVAGLSAGPVLSGPVALADSRPVIGACRDITSTSLMQDSGEPLNLTVKKTQGNQFSDVKDGQLPLGSIEGIEFKLYTVRGLDLTSDAGLAAAQKLTLEQARRNGTDLVAAQRTDAEGVTTFTGLKPAMYLVEEIAPIDTTHDYRTSDPFLVLLPTIDADCQTRNGDTVTVVKSRVEPPVPPTTLTPPTTPDAPDTPGFPPDTPPESEPPTEDTSVPPVDEPGEPPSEPTNPLAYTGANVLWALVAAGALIAGGTLLVRNRKDE